MIFQDATGLLRVGSPSVGEGTPPSLTVGLLTQE